MKVGEIDSNRFCFIVFLGLFFMYRLVLGSFAKFNLSLGNSRCLEITPFFAFSSKTMLS